METPSKRTTACDGPASTGSSGRAMGFLDMRAEIGNLAEGFARASDSLVMILTCPECATGYFVEDEQVPATGRAVRCASCGHRWTALPERPLELVTSETEGAIAREPVS